LATISNPRTISDLLKNSNCPISEGIDPESWLLDKFKRSSSKASKKERNIVRY
jgi:hypothetical protein